MNDSTKYNMNNVKDSKGKQKIRRRKKKEENKLNENYEKEIAIKKKLKKDGPPDIRNMEAIIKVFKTEEAYEQFRKKYLFSERIYSNSTDKETLEVMRDKCFKKKKKQELMYNQAKKNKENSLFKSKLHDLIFNDRNFSNTYTEGRSNYIDYYQDTNISPDANNEKNKNDKYNTNLKLQSGDNENDRQYDINSDNEKNKSEEGNGLNKTKYEYDYLDENNDKISINIDHDIDNDEIIEEKESLKECILDNIDTKNIEKNTSYKSFSFSDSISSLVPDNILSQSRFPSEVSKPPKSRFELPKIPRQYEGWHSICTNDMYEKRDIWNPHTKKPTEKFIIPGIDRKYQKLIPRNNGNNFWKICDDNIYNNLY